MPSRNHQTQPITMAVQPDGLKRALLTIRDEISGATGGGGPGSVASLSRAALDFLTS